MADNYTHFSEVIKCSCKLYQRWAKDHLEFGESFWVDAFAKGLKDSPEDHPKWTEFLAWCEIYDLHEDQDSVEFEWKIEDNGIWIYSDGHANVEQAARFMQEYLRKCTPNGSLTLECAFTCSKNRPGEFGGSAAFITPERIEWFSTMDWLAEKAGKLQQGRQSP